MTGPKEVLFQGNGSAVNVDLGFIPDRVELILDTAATNPNKIKWSRLLYNTQTNYGFLTTGSTGAETLAADADNGIIPYDTGSQSPTVSDYTTTVATAATARSATAAGTFVRPSTDSTMDRDAIFECVTAGTGAGEPTWPYGIGEQITEPSGDVVWERVNEARLKKGAQGVTIGATIQTDAKLYLLMAWPCHETKDLGDSAGW